MPIPTSTGNNCAIKRLVSVAFAYSPVMMDYYVRDAIHTSCCFAKCGNNLYNRSTDTFETMEIPSDYDPHLEFRTLSMLFTAVSTINRGQPSLEKGKVMCMNADNQHGPFSDRARYEISCKSYQTLV
jgi:hypothetical protein